MRTLAMFTPSESTISMIVKVFYFTVYHMKNLQMPNPNIMNTDERTEWINEANHPETDRISNTCKLKFSGILNLRNIT